MSLAKKLLGIDYAGGVNESRATDLDGVNDYLSRSSDFVGNADGKTFTFSCWIYISSNGADESKIYSINGVQMSINHVKSSNSFRVDFRLSGASKLVGQVTTSIRVQDRWAPLLISADMTNSSNRFFYLDDIELTVNYSVYLDSDLGFSGTPITIGSKSDGTTKLEGRLQDVFLDYTFRDLTVEANRRLFSTIDPDLGLVPVDPADLGALNPIMTAFTNPNDLTENLGTGGAWTVNGVMARSNRGANQFNAVASEFDGSADYLSKASIGASDSKIATISFSVTPDFTAPAGAHYLFSIHSGGATRFDVNGGTSGGLAIAARTSGNGSILSLNLADVWVDNATLHVSVSFDLSDTGKRAVFVNGVLFTGDSSLYSNSDMGLSGNPTLIARDFASSFDFKGDIGEFYFDTSYIDLATDNPFWDSDTNTPKYLGETGELPTGSQPLMYLPIRGGDEGNNLGSGGDFTVNGGPFISVRGGSEFWARSAEFDGSTGYLSRAGLTGAADSKTITIVLGLKTPSISLSDTLFNISTSGDLARLQMFRSGGSFSIEGRNSSNTEILNASSGAVITADEWSVTLLSLDLADSGNRAWYENNVDTSPTWSTYTDDELETSQVKTTIGANTSGADFISGDVGFFYFSDQYIDFTDESNRLLFVDGLGFPVPLQQSIDVGLIPEGLIRMGFEDVDDLGANDGTGGDFTINGTVDPGADVNV